MKTHPSLSQLLTGLIMFALAALLPGSVSAHCDGLDGPVVKAAQKALETGNVNLILVWVQKNDEHQIKEAFERTLAVRKLGKEARELADMYFFETLVRVHRAGEGAPYTGLKPAGRDIGPALPAADKALETGKLEPVLHLVSETTQKTLTEHFNHAYKASKYTASDLEAGREYVRAYVTYIHLVERMYDAAAKPPAGHAEVGAEEPVQHHEH